MDRRLKARLLLGIGCLGVTGLMIYTSLYFYYYSRELRWHSDDPDYFARSVIIHKGKLLYWSARRISHGASSRPVQETIVPTAELELAAKHLLRAHQDLIDVNHAIPGDSQSAHDPARDAIIRAKTTLLFAESSFQIKREIVLQTAANAADDQGFAGFVFSRQGYPIRETLLRFPLWIGVIPFMLCTIAMFRARAIFRRTRTGQCPDCGYDLRASTGQRCPECGRKIARLPPITTPPRRKWNKPAVTMTIMSGCLMLLLGTSCWRPFHYDHWPVSDLIAAPAPPWTHVMLSDGCLTIVKTASGNPPLHGSEAGAYGRAADEYESLLRKTVPSGFLFDRRMIVPLATQNLLRDARSKLVETLVADRSGITAQFSWLIESTSTPGQQMVFSAPLWPLVILLGLYPGLALLRKSSMKHHRVPGPRRDTT